MGYVLNTYSSNSHRMLISKMKMFHEYVSIRYFSGLFR